MTLLVWTLLMGCNGDGPAVDLPAGAADETGPYALGTTEDEVSGAVDLPLQIWYPTETTGSARYEFAASATLGAAQEDVPPLCETARPVVMFSHGNGGLRYQSVFLMEHLASNGFIVAAPDHVGNTVFDLDAVPRPEIAFRRPVDIATSFDALVARSNDPADSLHGCVDAEAGYAIAGHSFGGWTTLVVAGAEPDLVGLTADCVSSDDFLCGLSDEWQGAVDVRADPRVWAAVAISPVGIVSLGGGVGAIEAPTLVIGGLIDALTPWQVEVTPLYEGLNVDSRALAGIERTGHYAFTDFCLDGVFASCSGDIVPIDEVHRLTNGLVLSWLRRALKVDGVDLPPADTEVTWTEPG